MDINSIRIELALKGIDTSHLTDEELENALKNSVMIFKEVWEKLKKTTTVLVEEFKKFFMVASYQGYRSNNHRKFNNKHTIRFKQLQLARKLERTSYEE